jgi:hypothetical protein
VQQRRWALGTAQLLRKRLWMVLRSNLAPTAKLSVIFQLARHFAHPLISLMVLTVPLTTFSIITTPVEYRATNVVVFAIAAFGVAVQHAVAARAAGRSSLGAILRAPLVLALAVGLAPTYTVALWYGLRDRAGAFYRTPKVTRKAGPGEPHYHAQRSVLIVVECLVATAYAIFALSTAGRGWWEESAFCVFIAFSFAWMGLGSLSIEAESPRAPASEPVVGRESTADP